MFYNQTLLKEGAFIVCEDSSEYDENVPVNPEVIPAVRKELEDVSDHSHYDPVRKIYHKLKPYYENAKSYYQMMTPPQDVKTMVANTDSLSQFASELIDKLRTCEVKMDAMHHATEHRSFFLEPIVQNLGLLARNKENLIREGYSNISLRTQRLDFLYSYKIKMMVGALDSMGFGKSVTMTMAEFSNITRFEDNSIFAAYDSLEQMFDALFNDEVRTRMERENISDMTIGDVIACGYEATAHEHETMPYNESAKHELIKFASRQLRMVKIALNNFIIESPEYEYEEARAKYVEIMRCSIVALMDVFYVFMIDLHCKAYQVREAMDTRTCYNTFIENVKHVLRT